MADPKKPDPIQLDASPADTAQELARLRREVAELKARPDAQPSFAITNSTEVSAGLDDDGEQLWYYKIDLPPSGGIDIKINGTCFYHGEQYKIHTDTLVALKDIVFRTWQHEQSIHGSNENFYRRPTERTLRGNGR